MKNVILSVVVMFLIASCNTTLKFPVSSVTPAAMMKAKINRDKNKNFVIFISAKYLAGAERLTPPKKTYVAWISTYKNGVINIGQMKSKTTTESTLQAITAFEPTEIFITDEDEGSVLTPLGVEISRTTYKK